MRSASSSGNAPCDAIRERRAFHEFQDERVRAGEGLRQDLQRDIAIELGVARAIDLAHAPFAEQGHDFVRADASAGGERHGSGWDYWRMR